MGAHWPSRNLRNTCTIPSSAIRPTRGKWRHRRRDITCCPCRRPLIMAPWNLRNTRAVRFSSICHSCHREIAGVCAAGGTLHTTLVEDLSPAGKRQMRLEIEPTPELRSSGSHHPRYRPWHWLFHRVHMTLNGHDGFPHDIGGGSSPPPGTWTRRRVLSFRSLAPLEIPN